METEFTQFASALKILFLLGEVRTLSLVIPFFMKSEEDRISVCLKYLEYIKEKANNDEYFKKEILNLKGKTANCFCSNGTNSLELGAKYCPGHVLLAYSEYLLRKEDNVTQKV